MSRDLPGHVWPSLKFWHWLAFILSPSWVISFFAMDFVKKITPLQFVVLILTVLLLFVASICVLLKFYFFPQTNRFFRGYAGAKKIAGYAVFSVAGVGLNYLTEKSVASMLTFISLSLYCLCTLVSIQPHTGFGAFEFLLGGSVTQAFKCFGAHSPYSWLVVFACIVKFSIRYCLKPKQYSSGEASSHEHQDHQLLDQLEAGKSTPLISGGVQGALLGAGLGEIQTIMKAEAIKNTKFKSLFEQIQSTLDQITTFFDDIDGLNRILDSHPDEYKKLADKLEEGKKLLPKCAGVKSWNLYRIYSYTKKLIEFEKSLAGFFQIFGTAQISGDSRRTLETVTRIDNMLERRTPSHTPHPI